MAFIDVVESDEGENDNLGRHCDNAGEYMDPSWFDDFVVEDSGDDQDSHAENNDIKRRTPRPDGGLFNGGARLATAGLPNAQFQTAKFALTSMLPEVIPSTPKIRTFPAGSARVQQGIPFVDPGEKLSPLRQFRGMDSLMEDLSCNPVILEMLRKNKQGEHEPPSTGRRRRKTPNADHDDAHLAPRRHKIESTDHSPTARKSSRKFNVWSQKKGFGGRKKLM